jgi:hypothetical protein
VPVEVRGDGSLREASTTNPSCWHAATEVVETARNAQAQGKDVGVGLVLGPAAEGLGMTPIRVADADAALGPDKTPKGWAAPLMAAGCLVQLSAGGEGFHVLLRGATAHAGNAKTPMGEPDGPGGKRPEVKVLGASPSYVAMTGTFMPGRDRLADEDWEDAVARGLLERLVPVGKAGPARERPRVDVSRARTPRRCWSGWAPGCARWSRPRPARTGTGAGIVVSPPAPW